MEWRFCLRIFFYVFCGKESLLEIKRLKICAKENSGSFVGCIVSMGGGVI